MLRVFGDDTWLSQGAEAVLRRSDEQGEVMGRREEVDKRSSFM